MKKETLTTESGVGAQGDLLFLKIDALPKTARKVARKGKHIVVAASHSGHDHVINSADALQYTDEADPLVQYFVTRRKESVEHNGQHKTLRFEKAGVWQCNRQTEMTPDGLQVVQD